MFSISRPLTAIGVRLTIPSSPHEFFKVFLLSSDHRTSVDRPSTECWPITDRYIGEVSTNYRRSVGEVSVNGKLYRPRHIWKDYRPCLNRVLSDYRPSLDRLSTDYRPLYRPSFDWLSTECTRSNDYRPLYRPIDRSTLPTVNMIRLKQRQIKYCVRAFQNQLVNVQSACTVVYVVCLQCKY